MVALLRYEFQGDQLTPVPIRLADDLPSHIKGTAYWRTLEGTPGGPYHIPFNNNEASLPVEFINDDWYVLFWTDDSYNTTPQHKLDRGEYRVGWWNESDIQYPEN